MGIRNSYDEGIFCWVELATSDPTAAKQFYGQLFNWSFQDFPMEDGAPYSMAFKGDRSTAALYGLTSEMCDRNLPPHWDSYISVKDLDSTLQRWQAHSGTVIKDTFEVTEYGRMAVVQDPTGAVVSLWQAGTHIGAGVVNEVNTFCWTELQTRDAGKAAEFYKSVFGWQIEVEENPPYYVTCQVNGHMNCGMFDMDKAGLPAEIPPNWTVYFNVENLDKAIEQVQQMGGKLLMETKAIDVGRFVMVSDPQGAVVTIMELTVVDD
ncbi:MAG: VOC family protein [Cyanobacteria bacterium J06627_15]